MADAVVSRGGSDPTYPCPLCLRTLVPGASFAGMSGAKKGTGKVWDLSGNQRSMVTCTRCEGTGELENRRTRSDRRESRERRT